MKPNEDCEICQEDLIDQLGLLILEGRTTQDVKSNIIDCINCDDDLLHQRKDNFLSFWKSCNPMYIEVWVYHQKQFNENEAINGHDGYLLIEQWQLEIKLNRSDEHGLHCTEKMLIQAIKSKLYFSQLSAWLSLTKEKFPRQTYFRLCQVDNKTVLKRFIRAPDFHQFPRVNITLTKELVVSLYSLPHTDIPRDYPRLSWVLTDLPNETPQRLKSAEKLLSNSESSLMLRDVCSSHDVSHNQDYARNPSNVVRKLQFENLSFVEKKQSDQQQTTLADKMAVSCKTSKDVNNAAIVNHCTRSLQWDSSQHKLPKNENVFKEEQNLRSEKKGSIMLNEKKNSNSLTNTNFDLAENLIASDSQEAYELFCKGMESSGVEVKAVKSSVSNSDIGEYFSSSTEGKSALNQTSDSAKELYRTSNKSSSTQELMYDKGICQVMQHVRGVDEIYSFCSKSGASIKRLQECKRNKTTKPKQCSHNRNDSQILGTNSECHNEQISGKSLICSVSDDSRRLNVSECSYNAKSSSCKVSDDLNCEQAVITKDAKLKNLEQVAGDRPKLNYENLDKRKIDEKMRKSWTVGAYGNVLHPTKKDMKKILPQVRHLIDEEYKTKMNERLRNCCLSKEGCYGKEREPCGRKSRKTEKTGMSEDNIFSEQKGRGIPNAHNSNVTRYHFRHASTGTLPVFHPSTGLPMSSSPAPFRKTSKKQTVDDICSPPREPTNLSNQCCHLSKSAPTLTTQSLLVNFEESVLNDRLLPDGVVEGFTAELSASGSKKCLPHVTLPVQAYFFKLSDDNAPSPYMGYISLDVPGLPKKGYHVPKKGTIQLTLFNPNQTVVKVFVVLYDFSDMQANFQTFLRQKTTSLVKSDDLVDRIHDNLHYLIHLRLREKKENILLQHMHEKEFLTLTNKCGNRVMTYEPRFHNSFPRNLVAYTYTQIFGSYLRDTPLIKSICEQVLEGRPIRSMYQGMTCRKKFKLMLERDYISLGGNYFVKLVDANFGSL